jgi:hypothetical protein
MDPTGISSKMPQQELDAAHLGLDAHQVQRAGDDEEVAEPKAIMAKLEQEHWDQESDLLAQISNLDSRALSYEERLDELASTNFGLHEALCSQELGAEDHVDAIQWQIDVALQHQPTLNAQITAL